MGCLLVLLFIYLKIGAITRHLTIQHNHSLWIRHSCDCVCSTHTTSTTCQWRLGRVRGGGTWQTFSPGLWWGDPILSGCYRGLCRCILISACLLLLVGSSGPERQYVFRIFSCSLWTIWSIFIVWPPGFHIPKGFFSDFPKQPPSTWYCTLLRLRRWFHVIMVRDICWWPFCSWLAGCQSTKSSL